MLKRQLVFAFLAFLLKHKVTYASMCPSNSGYTEHDIYLEGFTLESFKVNTIFQCYRRCEENIHCASININLTDKTCELKYSTKTRHPEKTVHRQNTVYMGAKDDLGPPGSKPDRPIPSCKKLKEDDSQAKSGVYWMKINEPSSTPFQVFCDMTTDGGGWTLVYSYSFTQYSQFVSQANAVTPIPNWPVNWNPSGWVPQSTTTPLSESSHSSMDFALWKKLGNDILLKPNITNWVVCVEGTGSLVNWLPGSLSCRVVKAITPTCTTAAPNQLKFIPNCGPGFGANNEISQFLFDGRITGCWPVHDPCGTRSPSNHLTNVPNPGGAIYIR